MNGGTSGEGAATAPAAVAAASTSESATIFMRRVWRRDVIGSLDSGEVIDLRSDTQTRPSPGMREAMARAEVGDEQEREDPTVLELERRTAELLGHEEAVYLPTATMGNQIALAILGRRGSELIVEESAHIIMSELGGAAFHSGLQTRGLPGRHGRLSAAQVRDTSWRDGEFWTPGGSVLALENTHNTAGGTVWPLAELREVV